MRIRGKLTLVKRHARYVRPEAADISQKIRCLPAVS
jgi:hypothetical protein